MPKDHKRNTDPMHEARQKISEEKLEVLRATLEGMILSGEKITVSDAADRSGLSKSFLYKNETAKKLLEEAKNIPPSTVPREDYYLQYEELSRKLSDSYFLMSQVLSEENKDLKKEILELQEEAEKYKNQPRFLIRIIPQENIDTYNFSYTETRSQKMYAPFMVKGMFSFEDAIWGEHILCAPSGYAFSLISKHSGISLEKKEDDMYVLMIDESVTKDMTIDIKLYKK